MAGAVLDILDAYIEQGDPIPVDLHTQLLSEGINVQALIDANHTLNMQENEHE